MTADDQAQRPTKLEREHTDTRWWVRRIDRDIERVDTAIRDMRQDVDHRFDKIDDTLQEHNGRFDSIEMQLRSLTQLVGQTTEQTNAKLDKLLKRFPSEQSEQKPESPQEGQHD